MTRWVKRTIYGILIYLGVVILLGLAGFTLDNPLWVAAPLAVVAIVFAFLFRDEVRK